MKKLLSDLSLKTIIEHISGLTVWNVIRFIFIVCPSQGLSKLKRWPLGFSLDKGFFFFKKKDLGLVSSPYSVYDF